MALVFQGVSKSDITWAAVTDVKIRPQGSGSLTSVGRINGLRLSVTPLSTLGDPSATAIVYAVKYSVAFEILQTDKAKEIAMLVGVSGTGLHETDIEIQLVFVTGRTITLGTVTGYPLRGVFTYIAPNEDESQKILVEAENMEPIANFPAKVA